jgi:L-alanine-DL-glutamate epimerase-like enolase superfamily enzyme
MTESHASRRDFLKRASVAPLAAALPSAVYAAAAAAGPMKITRIEAVTFRKGIKVGGGPGGNEDAEWFWVRLYTDSGLVGTGETYPYSSAEIGALKDYSSQLLGRDPRDIDGIWRSYYKAMSMRNAGGADMRTLSAINMAQLDILGQASGLPLYRLLGGRTRSQVRVYNTTTNYWSMDNLRMGPDTLKIAAFLFDRGVTAMKIYPFNGRDNYLSNQALETGMRWIKDIRDKYAETMDICVDCWGGFDLTSAQRIARALEPYNIMYLEDAMLNANAAAYARLAQETSVPICMSETLATRYEYREFFEQRACDVVMYDLTWCGGVSEAKKIADMADTYLLPTSPHTCGGPLLYMCSAHLCTAVPNFLIMESNYWKYTHQFPYYVSNVPVPVKGAVTAPELPGIGAQIKPEIFKNGDAIVETVAKA